MGDEVEKLGGDWMLEESMGARKIGGQLRSPNLGFAMREVIVVVMAWGVECIVMEM